MKSKESTVLKHRASGRYLHISGEFSKGNPLYFPLETLTGEDGFLDTDGSDITLNEQQLWYIRKKFMSECTVTCRCAKPPRTHHCSTCGRCVLRMDHHCKWLANCVGLKNTKFFLNFVFYMSFFCLYNLAVITDDGIRVIKSIRDGSNDTTATFWV